MTLGQCLAPGKERNDLANKRTFGALVRRDFKLRHDPPRSYGVTGAGK